MLQQVLPYVDFGVIIVTFLFSGIVVFNSYLKMKLHNGELDEYIGIPNWDFSTSWATTLTTVGALLGTLLTIPNFPSTSDLSGIKIQSGLSLFFGLLALIAPLIYTASAKHIPPEGKDDTAKNQGTIRMFLYTATLTTWAVSGELVTVGISLYALSIGFNSIPTLVVFGLVLLLALFYAYRYAYNSLYWTVKDVLADTANQRFSKYKKTPEFNHELDKPENFVNPRDFFNKLPEAEKAKAKSYQTTAKNWSLL